MLAAFVHRELNYEQSEIYYGKFFFERKGDGESQRFVPLFFLLFDGLMPSETLVLLFTSRYIYISHLLYDLNSVGSFGPASVLCSHLLFCWFSFIVPVAFIWGGKD